MKKPNFIKILFLFFIFLSSICIAQVPLADGLVRLHSATNSTSLNQISNPYSGSLSYNDSAKAPYYFNGSSWRSLVDLIDTDNDTWIRVDDGNDNDKVNVNIGGDESYEFDKYRLQFLNDKGCVSIGKDAGFPQVTSYGYWSFYLTFIGQGAGESNTTGRYNTAVGFAALNQNTTGTLNAAVGDLSMYNNTTGALNTAFGYTALFLNDTGSYNTAFGSEALYECKGNNNIGIGHYTDVPDNNADNQVRIGNTVISYAGVQVEWSKTSDLFWKKDVRDLPYGINFIKKLRPVDFKRKNAPEKGREMGFIAQEVKQAIEEVGFSDQGFLTETSKGLLEIRYADFIALCIKGLQEQQAQLEAVIEENKELKKLSERVKALEKSLLQD